MKILSTSGKLAGFLKITAALAAIVIVSACATAEPDRQHATATPPIEVIHAGSGRLMTFHARETGDRLYVAGLAKEHPLISGTHVDVELIGATGKVIAGKQDDIDAPHPAVGGGRRSQASFVASFPMTEALQAAKIRITYHDDKAHCCS